MLFLFRSIMCKADTYFLGSVALFLLLLLGGLGGLVHGGEAAAHILSSVSAEAHVLLSLKIGMGSPDVLSDWKFEECSGNSSWGRHCHCRWRGVQCDGFHRVVGLNMSHMKLHGTISSEIGNLGNLINLTFACNALSGRLPVEITNLESLRSLNVSSNMFSGSFPSNISKLKELRVLDAYNNNFIGPLPVELSRLMKLEHVSFGGNYFSGKVPSEYSRIQRLRYLSLMGNELNGRIPREFGKLVNLKELYLGYYNSYEGGIPSEFGKFTNLVRLDMASCGLSGTIPPELGQLSSLDSLSLQVNSLSGHIPAELANLSNLMSLDISDNELTGEIPAEFRRLQKLTLLHLFKNKLHGTIPTFIAELPNFEDLGLWENNFRGEIPHNLGRNGKLLQLDLSFNRLTGLLPPYLCKSNKLQTLIMLDNFFIGPIPETLGNCKSLKRVRMSRNLFNGSIPNGFLDLPLVDLIELHDNHLTGVIPTSISVTWKLKQISLSNNRLTGPIPPAIGNLPSLQHLLLAGNQLTGSLPREIGRLKHIFEIDFSNNKLSGQIPPEISQCVSLIFMDLSRNDLGGTIPPEIAKMRSLNYLNISRNHLVGNIPEQIGGMSLTSVDLSYNNLSGVVPASGQFNFFNATTFVGNPGLCLSYLNPACIQTTKSYGGKGTGTDPDQLSSFIEKLFLVIGLVFCCSAVAIGGICKARIEWKRKSSRRWRLTAFQRLHFSCEDILGSLKEENIIDRGGSGTVYRGLMPNGQQVAVKRLPAIGMGKGSSHDDHGFSAEIRTLGKIRHRHIVKLLGFCSNQEINLLVYEYMANGSLGDMLHGRECGHLHWDSRYRIALEAAKGLCYLHHDCSPIIIHRDVKSNNILLGSNFEAHVAGFGLATFLQDSAVSQSMSSVAGSYGYIAPVEYAYTLRADEKGDVYSFGVVLLELITGRKPLGEFGEGVDIVQWVRKTTECTQERVSEVIDTRLSNSTVHLQEVMHLFFVSMLCVQERSIQRPTMREVVHMLTPLPNYNSKCQTTV